MRPWSPALPVVRALALFAIVPLVFAQESDRGAEDWREKQRRAIAEKRRGHLIESLNLWVDSYESGAFVLGGTVFAENGRNPSYVAAGRMAGALNAEHLGTHSSSLFRLMAAAERDVTLEVAHAMLRVASIGLDKGGYNPQLAEVRDQGHWALMRNEDRKVWYYVLRLAAWDKMPWEGDGAQDGGAARERVAVQVAALRLLGQRNRAVFRSTIESQVAAEDSRVRLAAVEALGTMARRQSLSVLVQAAKEESHPVVATSVAKSVRRILDKWGRMMSLEERLPVVKTMVDRLGLHGWRFDLEVIAIGEMWPYPDLIPVLINAMEHAGKRPKDEMLAKMGQRSSLRVRNRAWQALQALIGTLIPAEDVDGWREFWQKEKGNIRLTDGTGRSVAAVKTRASFYGIPIEGSDVGFLIDTSGSMDSQVPQAAPTGRRSLWRSRRRGPTRLELAKEQILQAVAHMDSEMRYHLFTFASECWVWNRRAVPPTKKATRALSQTLGRFRANGGTNVWQALIEVLEVQDQRFGQEIQNPIDELFILSDGLPSTGITDTKKIREMVREVNKYQQIKINCVFTGEGKGANFLRALAEENNGVFVQR